MMITSSVFNATQVRNRQQATTSHANHTPGMFFRGAPVKDQYTGAKVYPFSTIRTLHEEGKHDLASELVRDMRSNEPEKPTVGFLTLKQWSDWEKRLGLYPPKTEEEQVPKADEKVSASSTQDFSGVLKSPEPTPIQPKEQAKPPTRKSTIRSQTDSSQTSSRNTLSFGPLQWAIDAVRKRTKDESKQ